MHIRGFASCLVVGALGLTPAIASAAPPVLQPGTYVGVTRSGALMTGPLANRVVIVRRGDGRLRFSLTAYRQPNATEGDPAYRLPTVILGTLPRRGRTVTWTTKGNDADHNVNACTLTFTAERPGAIAVRQDEATCPFGQGVIANGRYLRTKTTGTLAQPFFHE